MNEIHAYIMVSGYEYFMWVLKGGEEGVHVDEFSGHSGHSVVSGMKEDITWGNG